MPIINWACLCIINKGHTSQFWGTTQLTPVSEFYITPFFKPVWYNRVLVNWPRAHCGVLQLTEASYLGPDSPRTSPRNETVKQCRRQMTVANSPVQLFIFGIFEHKWGTRNTLTTSKKYSWCIPVQKEIEPIIWGAAITPEPWNRQQCWFIFEDPNVRVARLLESLATTRRSENDSTLGRTKSENANIGWA